MKKRSFGLLLVLTAVIIFSGCNFGVQDKKRVTVMGDAEINVVPDEVVLDFGVRSEDKNLMTAKKDNDSKTKAILDTVRKNNIPESDIKTESVNITPQLNYEKTVKLTGYVVETNMEVVLHDIAGYDRILGELMASGANYVRNIEFKNSESRKYRDKARAMAIKAAKEKASAMAKELGGSIGDPLFIQEEFASPYVAGVMGFKSNVMANAGSMESGADSDNSVTEGSTLALGRIKISSRVGVTFELR